MSLRLLPWLIIVVFIITEAVSGEDVKKAVGDEVRFRPDKINSSVSSIIWKHKPNSGIVTKAIEWDDDGVNTPNQRFKHITTLNNKTGEITITDLTVEHSGLYTIDINSKEHEQRFNLEVLERVPKPVIETELSSNPDVVYIICKYSETIIWRNSTGDKLNGSKEFPKGELIAVKNRNPENYFTCTLQNAVSEETSDPVYEKDLFDNSKTSLVIAIAFSLVAVVIILIILSLYFCGYCAACCGRSGKFKSSGV